MLRASHDYWSLIWIFTPQWILIFCFKNYSYQLKGKCCLIDQENLLIYEAEGQEFAKVLRSIEKHIWSVKGQNNFWKKIISNLLLEISTDWISIKVPIGTNDWISDTYRNKLEKKMSYFIEYWDCEKCISYLIPF